MRHILSQDPEVVARDAARLRELEENDPFLRASRRNLGQIQRAPVMPGQESIERLPVG